MLGDFYSKGAGPGLWKPSCKLNIVEMSVAVLLSSSSLDEDRLLGGHDDDSSKALLRANRVEKHCSGCLYLVT